MSRQEYHRRWYKKNKKKKNAQTRAWRKKNPKRQKFLSRRWYLKHRKQHCERSVINQRLRMKKPGERKKRHVYNKNRWQKKDKLARAIAAKRVKKWRRENPGRQQAMMRRHHYGIEPEQYSEMLRRQNNACASCKTPLILGNGNRRLGPHVDHCHKTGKVRGILCQGCNLGLGHFLDSPLRLRQALAYLAEVKCPK